MATQYLSRVEECLGELHKRLPEWFREANTGRGKFSLGDFKWSKASVSGQKVETPGFPAYAVIWTGQQVQGTVASRRVSKGYLTLYVWFRPNGEQMEVDRFRSRLSELFIFYVELFQQTLRIQDFAMVSTDGATSHLSEDIIHLTVVLQTTIL